MLTSEHPVCVADDERFALPIAVTIDGEQWAAVTNWHCLYAERGEAGTGAAIEHKMATTITTLLELPAKWSGEATVAELRALGGQVDPQPCDACSGSKVEWSNDCPTCRGGGGCWCPCRDGHACHECAGSGKLPVNPGTLGASAKPCVRCKGSGVNVRQRVHVAVCGKSADALVVRKTLATAPDGNVRIAVGNDEFDPIVMVGDGWRALVMPMREPGSSPVDAIGDAPGKVA